MTFEEPAIRLRFGSGSEAERAQREESAQARAGGAQIPGYEEIISRYPAFRDALSVYAAGSVVQGWGHAASDIDLYVVTDGELRPSGELESFERRVATGDPVIHIVLGEFGPFRADIEVWRAAQIDEVISWFGVGTPSQEAPEPGPFEQDLMDRLAAGRPLHGVAWWQQRRDAIHRSGYGLWLAENRKLTAENYLEDVGGLLVSGDAQSALLSAHEAVLSSLEALLATHGDYSTKRKWLYRRLVATKPAEISTEEAWSLITMSGAAEDPGGWAAKTARIAQRLLLTVEGKAHA